ncbi:sensor histidine kinase [Nocardia sp. NPDC051570]|uniref:sensor histidine kinase n=1 Tax=Nocardia sp. NPDC051570 TaxID=3364324 RepID=UPI0037B5E49F
MSSSPHPDVAGGPRRRTWLPRPWSLRARLLVGQVLLLAVVCAGIGIATELALQQFLTSRLDSQLVDIMQRTVRDSYLDQGPPLHPPLRPPPPPPPDPVTGPGPEFLGRPGQPIGTIGAVVEGGRVTAGAILNSSDSRESLSDKANAEIAAVPVGGGPVTRAIDGMGRYRLVGAQDPQGETIVVGMPLADVDATLVRLVLVLVAVTVVALIAAASAGMFIVHRALAPLNRLAATAARVADLTLDRGEVTLPVRVPAEDATPRTEVGRLGSALNRMLDHITDALASRQASETRVRQFLADASHELRTPLTAIRGYAELAQRNRSEVPATVAHALGRVESEAGRMTHLVEDMLLLARLDSGRPLEQRPVDLSRLTVDAVSDAHAAGPDHRWNLDLPADPVLVPGDAARLHQVLGNLLANARTHTGPGTSVTTALAADASGGATWRVIDDGPGIPAELQPEIFERFARGDSSRSRRTGSTGLGLAIVAAVVKAHGGTIEVHSVAGRTEFTVRLPGTYPPHSEDQRQT